MSAKAMFHNGIATVGAYRGQLIRRVQCGGERFFYIGSDIHTIYPTPEQCRAAIDAAQHKEKPA